MKSGDAKTGKKTADYSRANKIQTEVITSHKKNVDIEWTWGDLEDKEDAEELFQVSGVK